MCPRQIPGKCGHFPKVSSERRRYKKHIDETLWCYCMWYLMHRAAEALNTEVCYCYYNFRILGGMAPPTRARAPHASAGAAWGLASRAGLQGRRNARRMRNG